jgi:hypothetical protein
VGALLCAGYLGFQRRVRLCVVLAVAGLVGWLVIGGIGGSELAGHFDETSALNGFLLVAVQYLAALTGATAGWIVRSARKER